MNKLINTGYIKKINEYRKIFREKYNSHLREILDLY